MLILYRNTASTTHLSDDIRCSSGASDGRSSLRTGELDNCSIKGIFQLVRIDIESDNIFIVKNLFLILQNLS